MQTITVMADFGNGPYAWLIRDGATRATGVGGCIADAVVGFQNSGFRVSPTLESDFAAWATWFEKKAVTPSAMAWPAFNAQGIALACRLKKEIGNQARVHYEWPIEDPQEEHAGIAVEIHVVAHG